MTRSCGVQRLMPRMGRTSRRGWTGRFSPREIIKTRQTLPTHPCRQGTYMPSMRSRETPRGTLPDMRTTPLTMWQVILSMRHGGQEATRSTTTMTGVRIRRGEGTTMDGTAVGGMRIGDATDPTARTNMIEISTIGTVTGTGTGTGTGTADESIAPAQLCTCVACPRFAPRQMSGRLLRVRFATLPYRASSARTSCALPPPHCCRCYCSAALSVLDCGATLFSVAAPFVATARGCPSCLPRSSSSALSPRAL